MMRFTPEQLAVIDARGNILVAAGAGTGKTRTLVERCVQWLAANPGDASIDRVLMVTFTEAAAAEMRKRIRERLTEKLAEHPDNRHFNEQIALLDTASIGTLHGFCLRLIREHFYALELDPQLSVLSESEAFLLRNETLESVLEAHYRGDAAFASDVLELIEAQGRGSDDAIRALCLKLHSYSRTLPNPDAWFDDQRRIWSEPEPTLWQSWLQAAFSGWRADWLETLSRIAPENSKAAECHQTLASSPDAPDPPRMNDVLSRLTDLDRDWPKRKKGILRPPLEDFFVMVEFLKSITDPAPDGGDEPLAEDWRQVRGQMVALLRLCDEFGRAYDHAKRDLAAVDFQDLEQFALRLLWDTDGSITPLAARCRDRFDLVFVDEYQDINAAQDRIIEALGRDGDRANRCLVGDVKQSIYRFRLANPAIFQNYVQKWNLADSTASVLPLQHNFRSHQSILDFVNQVFSRIMQPATGGIAYDSAARLVPGAIRPPGPTRDRHPDGRSRKKAVTRQADPPTVEWILRVQSRSRKGDTPADSRDAESNLSDAEQEARLIARRLSELRSAAPFVWDPAAGEYRAVEWRDMVVLLRSPRNKIEAFAKEFARQQVPLTAARGGFFDQTEVTDWTSVLTILDNPQQDTELLAVLRSPIGSMSADDLACIRLAQRRGSFWLAMRRFHRTGKPPDETTPEFRAWLKTDRFMARFTRWRRAGRHLPLTECLDSMIQETGYSEWLSTQPRGAERNANLNQFLNLALEFDRFRRQGLFRFLRFIETRKDQPTDDLSASHSAENCVRLLSIHQSKGLEFPVVAVADLGKSFNFDDLSGRIVLDEQFGLCPQIRTADTDSAVLHGHAHYPSLPCWLAQQRQRRESVGEEIRLLYVAMTRAADRLILCGSTSQKRAAERWQPTRDWGPSETANATNCLDWLGPWLASAINRDAWDESVSGMNPLFRWTVHADQDSERQLVFPDLADPASGETKSAEPIPTPREAAALAERLAWEYSYFNATRTPAKTSITAWNSQTVESHPNLDASASESHPAPWMPPYDFNRSADAPDAAAIGIAHHRFLENIDLSGSLDPPGLAAAAARFVANGILSEPEARALHLQSIAEFWETEPGLWIRAHSDFVHRELPFTLRVEPTDLAELKTVDSKLEAAGEFMVFQGVIDLAVLLPDQIAIFDFKTDRIREDSELRQKAEIYRPQLTLYALAMERIYHRPVRHRWLYFLAHRRLVEMT